MKNLRALLRKGQEKEKIQNPQNKEHPETQAGCGNVGVEATKLQVMFYSFLGGGGGGEICINSYRKTITTIFLKNIRTKQ